VARPASETVVLVTGATDGIGRQTALELAQRGCEVGVHGRSADKVAATIAAIGKRVPGARLFAAVFDLASLDAVRAGAAELAARPTLHVLVNNAGVLLNQRMLSTDGHELTFAVNHLAHYLLTRLLVERLRASAPARVVNVASQVHVQGRIQLDDLTYARNYSGTRAYADSKLANVLFTRSLAKRYPAKELAAYALHPGVIATKLLHAGWGAGGDRVDTGARTSVKCALDPGLEGISGRYYDDEREARMSRTAQDDALAEQLWQTSAELVGLPP
jgi:NAD(P)-dependent dehydrogenase (short-subunit alcohol dehydrogenase family)